MLKLHGGAMVAQKTRVRECVSTRRAELFGMERADSAVGKTQGGKYGHALHGVPERLESGFGTVIFAPVGVGLEGSGGAVYPGGTAPSEPRCHLLGAEFSCSLRIAHAPGVVGVPTIVVR